MFGFASKLGFAVVAATLCLGAGAARAQSAPVQYWLPSSWFGFGGPPANAYSFDGTDAQAARPEGWFMAGTRSDFGMSGFGRAAAFGNFGTLSTEGMRFGYNFRNSPVSIYSGFDTLKYDTGLGTSASGAFAAFDRSTTAPGAFSTNAGIEFRPSSNLSLSLGASFTQQSSGRVDSDINSPLLPGQSPMFSGGRPLR